jgi:N-acyl homoserine lactone hydrolase
LVFTYGRRFWQRAPRPHVVSSHDVPMILEGGMPHYIGKHEAAITAWYGDDMETTTLFNLTVG